MSFPRVLVFILVQLCIGQGLAKEAQGFKSKAKRVNPELRIFNGEDASPHAVPSIAFVQVSQGGRVFNCGGSLIQKWFVLTSAQCLAGPNTKVLKIFLGAHKFDRSDAAQVLTANSFQVHEEFKKDQSAAYDVALIKLSAPAKIQWGVVEVAELAPSEIIPDNLVGTQPTLFGWGLVNNKPEKTPKVLQKLQGQVVPYSACQSEKRASENALCLRRLDNQVGVTWVGDSGGPLVLDGVQIGVVTGTVASPLSWRRSEFGLFSSVDFNRKWIQNKINQW